MPVTRLKIATSHDVWRSRMIRRPAQSRVNMPWCQPHSGIAEALGPKKGGDAQHQGRGGDEW